MKRTRKLMIILSLVLLTLLAIASAILCYWFMPMAWKDPVDDNIRDNIAQNRMSRWEFYQELNLSDKRLFKLSIAIATPNEAFERFNGEDYKKDRDTMNQYFDSFVNQFIENHALADYPSHVIPTSCVLQKSNNQYRLSEKITIHIVTQSITPRIYLQEKQRISELIEQGIVISAEFFLGENRLVQFNEVNTYSNIEETFSLSEAFGQMYAASAPIVPPNLGATILIRN